MAKSKFSGGWNEPDSLDVLGEKQGWYGADLSRKSKMSSNLSNGRGAVGFGEDENVRAELGALDNIPTPSAADGSIIREIHTRGDVGFSESRFYDVFGKPQKPPQC